MDVRHFVNGRLVSSLDQDATDTKKADAKQANSKEAPSVEAVVQARPFTVISVGNCPQCEELAAVLGARGVSSSVFVKWDRQSEEYPALKASLAKHAGEVFSFPQVFMEGAYQGGFAEATQKLERGVFDALFEQEFDVQPRTLQKMIEKRSMIVFSLPNCPQCDQLREDLERRQVPAERVFVKLDKALPEYQSLKAQMQKLIGRDQFVFPQTFVHGEYQGNFDEVMARADKGEYVELFEKEFGIAAPAPTITPSSTPAISFDDDF